MSSKARRWIAALCIAALGAAACGNVGDDDDDADTGAESASESDDTAASEGDRDTFLPIEGVPGVTDDTIGYAVVGTRADNPLGTCILDCYRAGIEAYFAYRNSEGGIYGRELVVSHELDDELAQNQVRSLDVISSDDSFGAFQATLLAAGWGDLDQAGVPTYAWGIHSPEMADRQHIFGSIPPPCVDCTARAVPYAVQESGGTRVASLGYGVSENSKVCAQGVARSIERYSDDIGADLVYLNDTLAFGLPNGIAPEVTAMQREDVDFISTCLDLNGVKTLAQELERQGMGDVVIYHPNTYDQEFVREAGGVFDGDIVTVAFLPFEADVGDTALDEFLTWMDETGGDVTELAMVGWINADLAFQGLLAAGPEFDRASVVEATNQMTAYDAGGLIRPVDWTRQHTPPTEEDRSTDYDQECVALVRVVDGEFETVAPPDEPWLCWSNESRDWSEPVPTSFG
jgi:hypothetical protein